MREVGKMPGVIVREGSDEGGIEGTKGKQSRSSCALGVEGNART